MRHPIVFAALLLPGREGWYERRSLLSRLRRRLFGANELLELYLVLKAIGFGAMVLIVDAEGSHNPVLLALNRYVPDDLWGALLLFAGWVGLVAWALDIGWLRRAGALGGVVLWGTLSILILMTRWHALATTAIPLSAFFSGLVYVRLAGYVDGE